MLRNNKMFSRWFGEEAKERKLIKKLKKDKQKLEQLTEKLNKGTISKKELDVYYKLKEEINKMAQKFELKDGKLVLRKADDVNQDASQPTQTQPQTQPTQTQPQAQSQPQDEGVSSGENVEQQMREYEENIRRQEYLRQREIEERQRQIYEQQRREAMMRANQQASQQPYPGMEQQPQQQPRPQAQPQQQPRPQAQPQQQQDVEGTKKVLALVTVQDLPELSVAVMVKDLTIFVQQINKAIEEKKVFEFGPYIINGEKVLMYRFDAIEKDVRN